MLRELERRVMRLAWRHIKVPCWIVLFLAATVVATPAISADERVALMIGNSEYLHAAPLANPGYDAADLGAKLEDLGFAVEYLVDADDTTLRERLHQFGERAALAEIAIVYYAGHGIEVDGTNFMIPVDARLKTERDLEFETVPVNLAVRAVSGARSLQLLIVDACRDNPFRSGLRSTGTTRSISQGLAAIEPSGNSIVAYAARHGTVAFDGDQRNSPYAQALIENLDIKGLEIGLFFRRVRDRVLELTNGVQEPFVYGSISANPIYLSKPALAPSAMAPPTPTADLSRFDGLWRMRVSELQGCRNNTSRDYRFRIRNGRIDEPDHPSPKTGRVSADGELFIQVVSAEGKRLGVHQATITADRGRGTLRGRRKDCRGELEVVRLR